MKYKKQLFIAALLMSLIIIYFVIAKQQGIKNYEYLKTELIKGKEDDQAWLSILPQIDLSLQKEFKSCLKKLKEKAHDVNATLIKKGVKSLHEKEKCFLENKPVPILLLDCHETLRESMNELLELYTKGRICFSNTVWAHENLTQSNWFDTNPISFSSLIDAVRWLTDEIILAKDPLLALEQLDQLLDSFQPFSSANEAITWATFSNWRDRSYLLLFIKNRLSKERINTWLDEKPAFFQAVNQGITFDRKLNWEPFVQDLLNDCSKTQNYLFNNLYPDTLDFKLDSYKGLAVILQSLRCGESVFAKINNPLEIIEVKKLLKEGGLFSELYSICVPQNEEVLKVMALEASHRMARLLVTTVQLSGKIPEDEEELRNLLGPYAKSLDANDSQLPIRYEKVNDDRIRFYIPEDLGPLNVLKDREQSGKLRPNGSDSSQLPRQDWAYELQIKFE